MKKILVLLACCSLTVLTCALSACHGHTHAYAETLSYDETGHYYAATCEHTEERKGFSAHTFGEWEITKFANLGVPGEATRTCECGYYERKETPAASAGLEYTLNEDGSSYTVYEIGTCIETDVVIPATYDDKPVTVIGEKAFKGCESLTSITIPNSVTSIGDYAFYSCESLTSITIPNSVTSIGSYAFDCCRNLTSLTIPDSVISIGDGAFYYCDGLTSITIPSSITSIGDYAFYFCKSLTSITIPDSVTTIGEYAFTTCNNVTNLVIGNNVTFIGKRAFSSLSSLRSLVIPDSVTSIGDNAFSYCEELVSVTLGSGVTSIENQAFYSCNKLVEVVNRSPHITVQTGAWGDNGDVGYYALAAYNSGDAFTTKLSIDNGYIIYTDGEEKILVSYTGAETDLTLPTYVTQINPYAFDSYDNLTSVVIPNSVNCIGWKAFYNCNNLESVYYEGTESDWDSIEQWGGSEPFFSATRYYYSETQPTEEGNYWHYDEEGNPVVWE